MRTTLALAAAAALVACGPSQSSLELPSPISASRASASWSATLNPVGTSTVRGTATLQAVNNQQTMHLQITGGAPATSHPWHLHSGTCGTGGGVVGNTPYPALGTASDGTASMSTVLATPVGGGNYHVDVHVSPSDPTVAACGDLVTSNT